MEVKFEVHSADVDGEGSFIKPDYPISFTGTSGNKSIDDVAQEIGKRLWLEMHGETASKIHSTFTTHPPEYLAKINEGEK